MGECCFWYRPTRVVPDKRPLTGCVCVCVCVCILNASSLYIARKVITVRACLCNVRILFVFHKNKREYTGATVRPPRLNGAKMGVFATRSPHRPNSVGLTLGRVEKIEGLYANVAVCFQLD